MKEYIDNENAKKAEKGKRKVEKLEQKQREEAERLRMEEQRLAKERRAKRKEDKFRREEELREEMRKELRLELSMHVGGLREELQLTFDRKKWEDAKRKQKACFTSDDESDDSNESEVEALSAQADRLVISEKRKRSGEKPVGDSPPMETPAKRTAKQCVQLGVRHSLKKRSPQRKTPLARTTRRKIPAAPGSCGKLRYITDNIRTLGELTLEELRRICRDEDVQCEGMKKMPTILAIADKHTKTAYGSEEEEAVVREGVKLDDEDLPTLELMCMKQWSPVLNIVGKVSSKTKAGVKRKGRRERSKVVHPPSTGQQTGFFPVKIRCNETDEWHVNIFELLADLEASDRRALTVYIKQGNNWGGGWKSIRSAFGNSVLKIGGQRLLLKHCKTRLEQGGAVEVCQLRRWKPRCAPDKRFLMSLLKNPKRIPLLHKCNLDALIRLNGVARDFQKQSTTGYLRRVIARVIKSQFGWSLNARVTIRLRFDDRIRLVEVRKVVNDKIEGLTLPPCMKNVARNCVRIVWVRNPSVADILHNQRAYAKADVLTCTCAGFPYPRVGGHVLVRLQDLEGVDPLICNANNVPKCNHSHRGELLRQEIREGLRSWSNLGNTTPVVHHREAARCLTANPVILTNVLDVAEVHRLKSNLDGLVLTPLDRNPGETLVLCPKVYYEAMTQLFVSSLGYVAVYKSEQEVLDCIKREVTTFGLLKFAKWDRKGHIGEAYVMPKHKDLSRYRPICPTFLEPTAYCMFAVAGHGN
ncbi:hypothetical protein CBR_g30104 [Chara braunii]|uniref:Uncharacterized protein n=1 Tax=Chara braunii TaxID=69332 RepID=A0A388LC05_CHABU|nr:hypothetical protein CBR_g30104 [Chara braunii]|eukprot:GBG79839.1 hypothetical protein CBR_g30104 [Chara braunii]